jgi:hypothetical protein
MLMRVSSYDAVAEVFAINAQLLVLFRKGHRKKRGR